MTDPTPSLPDVSLQLVESLGKLSLTIIGLLLRLWVVTILWAWYIVPIFDLPPVGKLTVYGAMIIASFFREFKYHEEVGSWPYHFRKLAWPFGSLLFGWIGTLFM